MVRIANELRFGVCACLLLCIGTIAEAQDNLGKSRSVRILDAGPAAVEKPELPASADPANPDPASLEPRPSNPAPAATTEPQQTAPDEPARAGRAPPGAEDTPGFVVVPNPPGRATKIENSAELAVDIVSGSSLTIGSRVGFRVSSKKSGYLVLIDVDADGKLTQIYPNTGLLARNYKPNGNFIKPGVPLTIPSAANAYGAIEYIVGPPTGEALVVAVLCERPVQILDLSNIPQANAPDALAYVAKQVSELRIPEQSSGQLREAKWSFDSKAYRIEN